ncbi:MAG: right-handed parallel beta-helix repeat-containing protein [Acidobacteria bacterium]|nr:right-handed parallel beta-helix repeat-containing protein [Acidobacteriota bacterium]
MQTLRVTEPGLYGNILIDGEWIDQDLVRILADGVTLRNCTLRNRLRDAVEVYARNVRIENCHIHHVLNSTFNQQKDAHGITGRPLNLVIRDTEISHVSGDAIQFDPSRKSEPYPWDNIIVENSFLWTGLSTPIMRDLRRGSARARTLSTARLIPVLRARESLSATPYSKAGATARSPTAPL